MKRYTNFSNELRAVHFEDGSSQFLFRGQSFQTDKTPTRVDEGIRVTEAKEASTTTKKSASESK